jgi:acetate kinase
MVSMVIARRLRVLDPALAGRRVIVAHLGNGASLCAMADGRSVDTTISFTALDGLLMGSRPGNLDPGAVTYLMRKHAMSPEDLENVLYHRSGLLGISGISSDMRALLASNDARAGEAVDLFVFRAAREIGALTASLGGLDCLVFTAGIGEHSPEIRSRICARCSWLGIVVDELANEQGQMRIVPKTSEIPVYVIPTDEERMIAEHTLDRRERMPRELNHNCAGEPSFRQ